MAEKKKIKKEHRFHEDDLYPDEEQSFPEKAEEREIRMKLGERDEDVYTEQGREHLEDDDALEPWEEGFTEGTEEGGQLGKDALTGEPLMDVDDVIEAEIDGQMYRFATEENAQKFRKKKEREREEEED